jgi:hypothetical protein
VIFSRHRLATIRTLWTRPDYDREPCRHIGLNLQLGVSVIIVSGPSAEATRRVRISRYALACSRSSAVRNGTPRHVSARSISVHTEEHNLSMINNPVPPAGLAPGWLQGRARIVGVTGGVGIPSRRRRRRVPRLGRCRRGATVDKDDLWITRARSGLHRRRHRADPAEGSVERGARWQADPHRRRVSAEERKRGGSTAVLWCR